MLVLLWFRKWYRSLFSSGLLILGGITLLAQGLPVAPAYFYDHLPAEYVELIQLTDFPEGKSLTGTSLESTLARLDDRLQNVDLSPRLRVTILAVYGQLLIKDQQFTAAYTYCKQANDLAEKQLPANDLIRGYAQGAYGMYLDFYNAPELAFQPLRQAIPGLSQLNPANISNYQRVFWSTVRTAIQLGLLTDAQRLHDQNTALDIAHSDTTHLIRSHNTFGFLLQRAGYHDKAITVFDRGLALLRNPVTQEDHLLHVNILESKSHSLVANEQYEAGITNLQRAYFTRKEFGRPDWALQAMGYLVDYLMDAGEYQRALTFFEQEEDHIAKVKQVTLRNYRLFQLLGELFIILEQPQRAIRYTNAYQAFAAQDLLPLANKRLDAPSALSEHILLQQRAQQQLAAINQLKIQQLRREVRIRQYNIVLLIIALLSILLAAINYRWHRSRNERERQRAEADRQRILELENENLKYSINSRERDIKKLAADNRLRTNIKSYMLKYIDKINALPLEARPEALQKFRRELATTVENYEATSALQDQIETINTAFEDNLRGRIPGITGQEVRYCSLLRLGMTNQQIAQLLNKSDTTIRSYKYRINQKAGLQGKDALRALVERL
ncbi:MAG: hypothetical protein AAF828_04395 [Bacteroidota bacterium]